MFTLPSAIALLVQLPARPLAGGWIVSTSPGTRCGILGCVDLSFEPKESTDEIEKTQEVPGQFVKTRK